MSLVRPSRGCGDSMRISVVALTTALLACAGTEGARHHRATIADDGRVAIIGGESLRAPAGVSFFERRDEVHVVSLVPGSVFDDTVPLDPMGRPLEERDARRGAQALPADDG